MDTMLDLPTGRLIVGDPSVLFGDARPLDAALPRGRFPVAAGSGSVEVVLAPREPRRWERAPGFATPSGHVCLLDAAALEGFTGLGDEPVDEFELLAESLAGAADGPVEFSGLVVVPAGASVRAVLLGYGGDDRIQRIVTEFDASTPVS